MKQPFKQMFQVPGSNSCAPNYYPPFEVCLASQKKSDKKNIRRNLHLSGETKGKGIGMSSGGQWNVVMVMFICVNFCGAVVWWCMAFCGVMKRVEMMK